MRTNEIQAAIKDEKLDGWLFFDHHLALVLHEAPNELDGFFHARVR